MKVTLESQAALELAMSALPGGINTVCVRGRY